MTTTTEDTPRILRKRKRDSPPSEGPIQDDLLGESSQDMEHSIQEPHVRKRRKLQRTARIASRDSSSLPQLSFTFLIPPVDTHSSPGFESSASSPPPSETAISTIDHIEGTEDADRTPTQSIFQTQLPPSPPGALGPDEPQQAQNSVDCPAGDDHRRFFLEGIRNISTFAPQSFSLGKISLQPLHPSVTPLQKPALPQRTNTKLSQVQEEPRESRVVAHASYPQAKTCATALDESLQCRSNKLLRDLVEKSIGPSPSCNGSSSSSNSVRVVQGFSGLPLAFILTSNTSLLGGFSQSGPTGYLLSCIYIDVLGLRAATHLLTRRWPIPRVAQPRDGTDYIFNVNFSRLEQQMIRSSSNVEAAHEYISYFQNSAQRLYSKKYLPKRISHTTLIEGFFKVLEAQIWLQEKANEDPEIALVAEKERRMARRICKWQIICNLVIQEQKQKLATVFRHMGADGMSSDESSSQDGIITNLRRRNTVWRSEKLQNLFEELWELHSVPACALDLRPKVAEGLTSYHIPCGLPPGCYAESYLKNLDPPAYERLLTTNRISSLESKSS